MNLTQWAVKHKIPYAALVDMMQQMGTHVTHDEAANEGESEGAVQTRIRLEASGVGARLWRNNVGACTDNHGNFIRYGLANDSKQLNAKIKSSDLIGIRPIRIEQQHVGHVIGQFIAREVKEGGWKFKATQRENAQKAFIELIKSLGGDACFASDTGTI